MNIKILTSALFLLVISLGISAQTIPNSGFENWGLEPSYEEPDQFSSSNPISISTGNIANVRKTTDSHSGEFAVELETVAINGENLLAGIYIGDVAENQQSVIGGIPFNARPDSIKGFVKYNIPDLDTASLGVFFKKFGVPWGFGLAQFTGVQETWIEFSAPIMWLVPIISPDTLVTGITSSTIFAEPLEGSSIIFDSIHFIGTSLPYPNGEFEEWTEVLSEEEVPDDWLTSNVYNTEAAGNSITKTDDSYQGDYAVKLENKPTILGNNLAILTNGYINENVILGGMMTNKTPERLTGYYKYIPEDSDTALVRVTLFFENDMTGLIETLEETTIKLPAVEEYTEFELTVPYNQYPPSNIVNISFFAGNTAENAIIGSTLFIDALHMTYKPEGIDEKLSAPDFKAFPNPASDVLIFKFENPFQNNLEITVINILGVAESQEIIRASESQSFSLDVSKLENGIYFYQLKTDGIKEFTGKFFVK